jgi:hypothetical protein
MSTKKGKMQSGKIRTFLLFLALACIIWVLTKFSKEVSASVSAELVYTDLPANTILSEGNPGSISFDVTGTGYDFLLYQIKPPVVELAVDQYYQQEKGMAVVENAQLVQLIARVLDGKESIRNLSITRLTIGLDRVEQVRVPVRAVLDISYREGFFAVDSAVTRPDSVTVSGPQDKLLLVSEVATQTLSQQKIDRSLTKKLLLSEDLPKGVSVSPAEVEVTIKVEEYSPKNVAVTLELVNAPSGENIRLVPAVVNIAFDIPVSAYNQVDATDFRLVCDFDKRNSEENFLLPVLIEKPVNARNIEFSHNKVDYLIFKSDD